MAWDTASTSKQESTQASALRTQLVDAVGPFSPFWRARLKALGTTAAKVATPAGLAGLPAVGERDVCPDGSPAGAAGLVLQAGEADWALHTEGPRLRKALTRRLVRKSTYRAIVEADTRPTSFVFAGLGLRWPVASTRSDLDVVARAGARLWQVLGLSAADVLVCGLPLLPTAALQAVQLGALGAGSPALFPGDDEDDLRGAATLVPVTVLALDSALAAEQLQGLQGALSSLRMVLLVGAPSDEERAAVTAAVAGSVVVRAAHVPDGHRLMWAECGPGGAEAGLHTYPDLDLVQLVDPESGETREGKGAAEVVLTQLGMRGTALLRWRTGDLAESVTSQPCPACRRTVPRVMGVRRGALVTELDLRSGPRAVDLRAVSGALAGRGDVSDWRVLVGPSPRSGRSQLLVHVVPRDQADMTDVAIGVARDVRTAAGVLPTQVVMETAATLPQGRPLSRRVHQRV